MSSSIFDSLSLVDPLGRLILASALAVLVAALSAHALLRTRYLALQRDLERNGDPQPRFTHAALIRIAHDVESAARRSDEPNVQAIIEDGFQANLRGLLLAERFVKAATGLVLILGLLGTFYGLTLSIGKLAHLVSPDAGPVGDVAQAVTHGLTQALSGMAVAFSNSLVGVGSAIALTVVGVINDVTDRRTSLMIQLETYLDRLLASRAPVRGPRAGEGGSVAAFAESVVRLEGTVARFEAALQRFTADTKGLREVQLVVALKPGDGR